MYGWHQAYCRPEPWSIHLNPGARLLGAKGQLGSIQNILGAKAPSLAIYSVKDRAVLYAACVTSPWWLAKVSAFQSFADHVFQSSSTQPRPNLTQGPRGTIQPERTVEKKKWLELPKLVVSQLP